MIHQCAAKAVAQGDGEELEGVADGIDPALQIERDMAAHDHVQVGVHQRDGDPAQKRADAPHRKASAKGQEEVFRAHGDEQRVADDPDTAFGRRHRRGDDAAQQHGEAGDGVDDAVGGLAAAGSCEHHGGQSGVVHGRSQVDGSKKQDQGENALLLLEVLKSDFCGLQNGFLGLAVVLLLAGQADPEQQGQEGSCKGDKVEEKDHFHARKGGQGGSAHRGQDIDQGVAEGTAGAGLLVVILGGEQGGGDVGGGLLHRVHQA